MNMAGKGMATPVVAAQNPMKPQDFSEYDLADHVRSLSKADKAKNPIADAHTLIGGAKIKADKGRHAKAKAHLAKMAAEAKAASGGSTYQADNDGDESGE